MCDRLVRGKNLEPRRSPLRNGVVVNYNTYRACNPARPGNLEFQGEDVMRVFFTTALRLAATAILLLLLPVAALAQPDAHHMNAPKPAGPPSEAQAAFDMLKTFAGEWEGPVKANLPP